MNDKIGLVTDSTADLPPGLAEEAGVAVVPAIVVVDGKGYQDGSGLTRPDFYRTLPTLSQPASTAAPAVEAFEQAYRRLFAGGAARVLSIHLSRRLSGIYGIAAQAARRFGERVAVIDSGQVSLGLGFQVLEAARAIRRGDTWSSALHALADAGRRIRTIAMIEQLDYLRRSGRVDWIRSSLGSLLHVRLLLEVADGIIHRLGQFRTRRRAIEELSTIASGWGPVDRIGVLHSAAEDEARELAARLRPAPPAPPPLVVDVTPVIGTHVGPRCLGVVGLLH
jgi:DegV family protein with EDD domain